MHVIPLGVSVVMFEGYYFCEFDKQLILRTGIFLGNTFRGANRVFQKYRGQNLNQVESSRATNQVHLLKLILSLSHLRHNSGGKTILGGQNAFAPLENP